MGTGNNYNAATNWVNGASYDAAGNLTSYTGSALTYDVENRITSATQSGIGSMYYSYDGAGQQVQEVSTYNTERVFVYDVFGHLSAEYSIGMPASPCKTCYLSTDHLGSTRLVTDENGNTVGRHDYLPFGEEITANAGGRDSTFGTQDFVNQKFTGQERDVETGLDFFHARYFSAALGRFNSPDPANAGADIFNPQSWNAYSYVANNPLTLTDPAGMDPQCQPGASWFGEGCYGGGGGAGASLPSGANPYLVEGSQGAVNTGSNLGGGSGNLSAAENKYVSNFAWKASGLVYGKAYNQYFSSLDAYFDWRTGIAGLPESKAYIAYGLDCQHSSISCSGNDILLTRYQGPTGNYELPGHPLDPTLLHGMIPDPSFTSEMFHPGQSAYTWSPVDTGHVATYNGYVESHQDLFNGVLMFPFHYLFDVVPSFFINPKPGVQGPIYVCSPIGDCHP